MKPNRMLLSFIVVSAVVSSAFAIRPLGQGQIYCLRDPDVESGSCLLKIDWKFDPAGTVTDPCHNGQGKEYFLAPDGRCIEINPGTFSPTPL